MTKAMTALEAEKAELVRIVLDLDDMELVKRAKTALKYVTVPRKNPFFTNSANLEYFRRSMK